MKQTYSINTILSFVGKGRIKGISFLLIAVFLCASLYAQSEIDAFRISGNDLTGTARGQAMGGAFGALGGDITGVIINPAGIGVYRSSELSATLGLNSTNIKTQSENSVNDKAKLKFNLDNISYVGYFPVGSDNLQSINFGFSYNKGKDFNRNYFASGKNSPVSLTDYICHKTNGVHVGDLTFSGNAPWLSTLGWEGGLITEISDDKYKSSLKPGEKVNPQLTVSEKGYIDNYNFTLGTNFSNSFYLGFSLSLTDVYYRMESLQSENVAGTDRDFRLNNYLQTEGSGYQVKLGAIWRPVDFLRLAVAYHSPTWYALKDSYQGHISANLLSNWSKATPDDTNIDYRFSSPYSWTFSAAGILGTHAIISVDYEIKNYKNMAFADQYSSVSNSFEGQNKDIDLDFKMASTLRAGLEYRFTSQFSGRLGYSLKQHPYETKIKNREIEIITAGTIPHYTIEGDINYFTAGLGYRFTPNFYMDAALVYRTQKDDLYYYSPVWNKNGNILVDSKPVSFTNTSCKGLVTLGYKF
jgi:hypothetical protein